MNQIEKKLNDNEVSKVSGGMFVNLNDNNYDIKDVQPREHDGAVFCTTPGHENWAMDWEHAELGRDYYDAYAFTCSRCGLQFVKYKTRSSHNYVWKQIKRK